MRITCPYCNTRDLREFTYLGAASLLQRPDDPAAMQDYIYSRENPAGENAELWQHTTGCRAWLHVVRNTATHEILSVRPAREVVEDTP